MPRCASCAATAFHQTSTDALCYFEFTNMPQGFTSCTNESAVWSKSVKVFANTDYAPEPAGCGYTDEILHSVHTSIMQAQYVPSVSNVTTAFVNRQRLSASPRFTFVAAPAQAHS